MSEYSGGLWSRDYIAEGSGELIATENASGLCSTCYFGYDHLGSVRIVMDQNGGVVARHDYLPFGEELPGGMAGRTTPGFGAADLTTQRFTGQVRDSESGQDFFNARYFMAPLGRFNSADPGNAGASLGSSQSWNGYAYVLGNPLNAVDPSGMTSCSFANPCVGLYPSGSSKRPANQFGNLSPFGSYNASSLSSVINTISGSAYAGAVYYGDETGNSEVFDLGLNINSYTSYSISSYLNISYSTSVTASVMHVTPQAKPIKIHGNWCGPDWTGSQAGEYDPSVDAAGAYANPIDRQDSGCMHHDKCYFQCRQQNTCTPAARSSCFASCDRVLSRASSAIPPWQSGVSGPAIDLLMFFRGADLWPKDDPGPNPASCSSQ